MPTGRRSARCASTRPRPTSAEGEFQGVELTFMGLNNQNLHNFLFRGFLKPWEEYTGATDQLDRPGAGRLQRPPAAVDRDRHGRFRHHRDGRALRGRRLRQGPRVGDARLGRQADRDGRLRRLPPGAGRHLGRQDLSHLDRRRLPQLQLPHRLLRRRGARQGLAGGRPRRRVGRADHLAAGPGGRPSSSRASRSAASTPTAISTRSRAGAASASTSSAAAPPPTPSIRTIRPGCSTSTP